MKQNTLFSDDEDEVDEICANWNSEDSTNFNEKNILTTLNCDTPTTEHRAILAANFGHTEFRPLQWKIISCLINECRDACAVIATGYGKSLCYQYPPVFKNGVAIVISPLISLMEDQVLSLKMSNIPACFLGSAQSKSNRTIKEILEGKYKVVYATPEYVTGECGLANLHEIAESNHITLLAIDEAHCVSQWGHDFRPQYRKLWKVRNILPNVPVLAVTATATPLVQEDIINSLRLRNPLAVCSSFDRPNLFFEVKLKSSEPYLDIQKCMTRIGGSRTEFNGSTIIYCLTQKSTEAIYRNLSGNRIKCVMYHAGLSILERRKAHEDFVKDKVKCIIATIAFGMGIDKPDVRNIIHYGASKDLEGYYQQVGRAGRDGLAAKCIIFFSSGDFIIHQNFRERLNSNSYKQHAEENSNIMEKFLNTTECRRKFILRYFNDKICCWEDLKPRRKCCDNCLSLLDAPAVVSQYEGLDEKGMYNLAEDAKLFLQAVSALNGKFGAGKYCLLLKGSKRSEIPPRFQSLAIFGKGSHKPLEWWKIVGRILTAEGYLIKKYSKNDKINFSVLSLSSTGTMFLYDKIPNSELKIIPTLDMKQLMTKKIATIQSSSVDMNASTSNHQPSWISKTTTAPVSQISSVSKNTEKPEEKSYRMELYKILLNIRNDLAHSANCSPYMVASNTALMSMSKIRPKYVHELKSFTFDGMAEGKINKFGPKFVEAINIYCSNKSDNYEITLAPNSTEVLDKLHNKTGICDLQQFAFVENKINVSNKTNPSFSDQNDDMESISDIALNNIYDNLDQIVCETNETTDILKDDCAKAEPEHRNTLDKDDINANENSEERKQGLKNKRSSDDWCVTKRKFCSKFLEF